MKRKLCALVVAVFALTMTVNDAAGIARPTVRSAKSTTTTVQLTLRKPSTATGIRVYGSTRKNTGYRYLGATRNSISTIKKLKANTTYYFKIRAYRTRNRRNTYSALSAAYRVVTKKAQSSSSMSTLERQVLNIMNQKRRSAGLSTLTTSTKLQLAARARAKEIVRKFSHTRPNGSACFTMLDVYKISYRAAGENIASGFRSASAVMNGWMNSPGHKANILSRNFGKVGIGYYNGYWVQLFTN